MTGHTTIICCHQCSQAFEAPYDDAGSLRAVQDHVLDAHRSALLALSALTLFSFTDYEAEFSPFPVRHVRS